MISTPHRWPQQAMLADVVALVPRAARRILDLGCGTGVVGRALKERQDAEVVGLEVDPRAAQVAHGRLDRVQLGGPEFAEGQFADSSFDCVVCLDLLPYLGEPGRLLRGVCRWLRPGGTVVASVPNVRHHRVLADLLEGRWSYRVEGACLRPQLRFFTRRETEKLFFRSGFEAPRLCPLGCTELEAWQCRGRPRELQVGSLRIGSASVDEAWEFYVPHYAVVARPAPPVSDGLTSIVVVAHNQLAYTQACLDSVRRRTDEPYELVVVDNASTDGTAAHARQLGLGPVIVNDSNRGFPAAANQGIRAARGQHLLLLNNDTVVTTGWLRRLLDALHSAPNVGLVGPCSNAAGGDQQVGVPYAPDLDGLDGFAWDWGKARAALREPSAGLDGFCLLARRELVERVGLLDERFGLGGFEDVDYCRRAHAAGYQSVIARDAFVHHFGRRTFAGSGVDVTALMQQNQQLFDEKWRRTAS